MLFHPGGKKPSRKSRKSDTFRWVLISNFQKVTCHFFICYEVESYCATTNCLFISETYGTSGAYYKEAYGKDSVWLACTGAMDRRDHEWSSCAISEGKTSQELFASMLELYFTGYENALHSANDQWLKGLETISNFAWVTYSDSLYFFFLNLTEGVDGAQGSVGPRVSAVLRTFPGPPVLGAPTRHFWGPEEPPIISIWETHCSRK